MTKKPAFTLIELLVVIAIIALLVSILLPSLNKAKSLAQAVVCSTNLKALGTSHAFWIEDHDGLMISGYIPLYSKITAGAVKYPSDLYAWQYGLAYLGYVEISDIEKSIYACPNDDTKLNPYYADPVMAAGGADKILGTSYGWNWTLGYFVQAGYISYFNPIDKVTLAAETIAFADNSNPYGMMLYYPNGYYPLPRHNDKGNIAWADGHVTSEDESVWQYEGYAADLGYYWKPDKSMDIRMYDWAVR